MRSQAGASPFVILPQRKSTASGGLGFVRRTEKRTVHKPCNMSWIQAI
jgi:hypothetical protein